MMVLYVLDLNTSYVDIKHQERKDKKWINSNLNTSYVDIKRKKSLGTLSQEEAFKYILC